MDRDLVKSIGIGILIAILLGVPVVIAINWIRDDELKRRAAIYERITGEKISPSEVMFFDFVVTVGGEKKAVRKGE